MKFFLLLFCSLLACGLIGQPVLYNDLPGVGFTTNFYGGSGLTPGAAGSSVTWDYHDSTFSMEVF